MAEDIQDQATEAYTELRDSNEQATEEDIQEEATEAFEEQRTREPTSNDSAFSSVKTRAKQAAGNVTNAVDDAVDAATEKVVEPTKEAVEEVTGDSSEGTDRTSSASQDRGAVSQAKQSAAESGDAPGTGDGQARSGVRAKQEELAGNQQQSEPTVTQEERRAATQRFREEVDVEAPQQAQQQQQALITADDFGRAGQQAVREAREATSEAVSEVKDIPADETEDFNDTPVRVPESVADQRLPEAVAGQRVETIANRATRKGQQLGRAIREEGEMIPSITQFSAPALTARAISGAGPPPTDGSGESDVANIGSAAIETGATFGPGLVIAAKETGETAVGVAEGDVSPGEVAGQGGRLAEQTARSAGENPQRFFAGAGAETILTLGAGAAVSRGVGTAVRAGRDRARTVGAERIDAEEITNPDTLAVQEGRLNDPSSKFPGASNKELFKTDPAAAVRQQARDFTPEQIRERVGQLADDEAVIKKALDVEPDSGTTSDGFRTQEGSFESPGGFFGPELSPNFLRIGSTSKTSLRPGLPDFGGQPTGVLARTKVKNPDADTLEGFNRELLDREGETTARTKPPKAANPSEAEAVVPPKAQFRAVDSGGIGSDFYTEIGGRRVPLRLVEPDRPTRRPDSPDSRPDAGGKSNRGDGQRSNADGKTLEEFSERVEPPEDNLIPIRSTDATAGSNRRDGAGDNPRSRGPSRDRDTSLPSRSSPGSSGSGSPSIGFNLPSSGGSPPDDSGGPPTVGGDSGEPSGSPPGSSPPGGPPDSSRPPIITSIGGQPSGDGGGGGGGTPPTPQQSTTSTLLDISEDNPRKRDDDDDAELGFGEPRTDIGTATDRFVAEIDTLSAAGLGINVDESER